MDTYYTKQDSQSLVARSLLLHATERSYCRHVTLRIRPTNEIGRMKKIPFTVRLK